MPEAKLDRRVRKTRHNLFNALTELMREKKYSKITIQEIIDRADVGRSTFYAHFETKDDLLFSQSVEYLNHLNEFVRKIMDDSNELGTLASIEGLFDHVYENEKIISSFFVSDGMELFKDKAVGYWTDTIEGFLLEKQAKNDKDTLPPRILASHIAMTLVNMLSICLAGKVRYSPKQLDAFFKQLLNPVISDYLSH